MGDSFGSVVVQDAEAMTRKLISVLGKFSLDPGRRNDIRRRQGSRCASIGQRWVGRSGRCKSARGGVHTRRYIQILGQSYCLLIIVFHTGSIPHDWLFADGRVSAVCHHGGESDQCDRCSTSAHCDRNRCGHDCYRSAEWSANDRSSVLRRSEVSRSESIAVYAHSEQVLG